MLSKTDCKLVVLLPKTAPNKQQEQQINESTAVHKTAAKTQNLHAEIWPKLLDKTQLNRRHKLQERTTFDREIKHSLYCRETRTMISFDFLLLG